MPRKVQEIKNNKMVVKGNVGVKGRTVRGKNSVVKSKSVEKVVSEHKDITPSSIRYLARRAGITRMKHDIYPMVYEYISGLVKNVIYKTIVVARHSHRKTLQQKHLETVLRLSGTPVALSCANINVSLLEKHKNRKTKKVEGKTRRHYKQGTIAAREIKHEQKRSDRSILRFLPFRRMVYRICEETNEGQEKMRISSSVFQILQLYVEVLTVRYLQYANMCAQHANRISIKPSDLVLVRNILNV